MTRPAHTGVLMVVLLGVGVVDVSLRWPSGPGTEAISGLPALDPMTVDRVEIGRVDDRVVLTRADDGWVVGVGEVADTASIDALLRRFAGAIRPESVVDDGRYDAYGLAGGDERVLALWGADVPLRTVMLGHDGPDGSTFARLDEDASVVRIDIGTRGLLERSASQWLDRQVVDLDPDGVDQLVLSWGADVLVVDRRAEGWVSEPPTDAAAVQAVVRRLAHLRGRDALGVQPVDATVDIALRTATDRVELGVGRGPQGPVVGREGRAWTLDPSDPLWGALQPGALHDRRLVDLTPDRIRGLIVDGPRGGRVERVPAGWAVVQPVGVDVDTARVESVVTRITAWRATSADENDPFEVTGRVTLETADGREVLELGRTVETASGVRIQVRSRSAPQRVASIDGPEVEEIKAIFGR